MTRMHKPAAILLLLLIQLITINAQDPEYLSPGINTQAMSYQQSVAFTQEPGYQPPGRNGIFTEIYLVRHDFSDGFISLNYERLIGKKGRSALRIGIYPDFESTISFPLIYQWISTPAGKHHFEWGAGAVFRIENYMDPYDPYQTKEWFYDFPAFMVPIMYRYQKGNGLIIRGGINLFLSWPVLPSPSFSVGYRF